MDSDLRLLKNTNPEKAVGIGNLSGRFLKNGAVVLASPLSKLCNLLTKCSKFSLNRQTETIKERKG